MQFYPLALIALWTLISGPIFAVPPSASRQPKQQIVKVVRMHSQR